VLNRITYYVVSEYLKYLLLGLVTFFLIFFVVELFERMNTIIVKKAPVWVLLEYFAYTVPPFLSQTLPFTILLATLITFGIFSRRNEIVAMKAHGISTYSLIVPIAVIASIATGLMFVGNETLVPYSVRRADYIWEVKIKKEEKRSFCTLHRVWYRGDHAIYNVRLLEEKKNRLVLHGVTIYRLDDTFRLRERIDAGQARWDGSGWIVTEGVLREFKSGGEVSVRMYDSTRIMLDERPEDFRKGIKHPEEMSYAELRRYVERLEAEGYENLRYEVDLHAKLSFPCINLIMVLIGGPLALATGRLRGGGIAQGVGLSLVVGFVYWVAFRFQFRWDTPRCFLHSLPPGHRTSFSVWSVDFC
jgi:lipopolysaccharide export system permease protein